MQKMSSETELSATQIEQLDEALEQLAMGASLNEVLAKAGAEAAWLRPMLTAATVVKDLPPPYPLPSPDASLQRMLAHAEKLQVAPPVVARPMPAAKPDSPGLLTRIMAMFTPAVRGGFHVAALAASILIAFLAGTVFGTGAIFAAQQSLPGDPGYGLKRTLEDVQLGLTFNPVRRDYLQAQFNDRRRLETEQLLEQGRQAEIIFEDKIQTVDDNNLVMGLVINLTDSTEIDGQLTPGARVRLQAITDANGQITAVKIEVIQPGTPVATPTASPTNTASPTSTATPPPTATPSATSPAQTGDTLALPPTHTPSPQPTSGPTIEFDDPTPGSDAVDNSNFNDNFEDNSGSDNNQNSNDDFGDDNSNDGSLNDDNSDDLNDDNNGDDSFNDNTDDGSNDDNSDKSDDDLSNDDFEDDEFYDDPGSDSDNDSNSDSGSDNDSGSGDDSSNDNSDDAKDDDHHDSGSSNRGSGSSNSGSSNDSNDDDDS